MSGFIAPVRNGDRVIGGLSRGNEPPTGFLPRKVPMARAPRKDSVHMFRYDTSHAHTGVAAETDNYGPRLALMMIHWCIYNNLVRLARKLCNPFSCSCSIRALNVALSHISVAQVT